MEEQYDAIVIGAGHNGLTCACYLAAAGLKVLVLEQYHTIGGMTITEEITLPGFHSDVHASGYQLANFSPVPHELTLENHGLEIIKTDWPFSHAFPDGRMINVNKDINITVKSIEKYSKRDAETWRNLSKLYLQKRDHIISSFFSPPPSLVAQAKAFEKTPNGMEAHRFSLQSVRAWSDETFEAEETKCLFGSFASFLGASPDDACGAELAWLFACVLQNEGNNLVKGGMQHLSFALANYLKAKGGIIKTNARVDKIIGNSQRATKVKLTTGEEISVGKLIASNVDPGHLVLELLGVQMVGEEIVNKIKRYEWGDSVFVIYVALSDTVHYKAGIAAGKSAHVHLIAPSLDALSKVYLECRGGLIPSAPLIVSWNDSIIDPSRAPIGKQLMKFVVLNVPYKIKGDASKKTQSHNWKEVKDIYADYLIDMITENYIPDLKSKILKKVAHSPVDIEHKIISAVHGTLGHGAFVPYQIGSMRPIPELGEYRTPISNVYLCGSGSHPGPGVSMAPGRNAAHVICQDLNISLKVN